MKVLLATDLSAAGDPATALIHNTPWPEGSAVRVITALEPYAAFVGLTPETVMQFDDIAVSELRSGLEAVAERVRKPGLAVDFEVLLGRPADEIVAEARAFGADIVVVGNRGKGPFEATLLGSVSSEVVDRSPCPVLVARTATCQKVVVADDGSPGARVAVELVAQLPVFSKGAAHVIGVVDVPLPWASAPEAPMVGTPALDAYEQVAAALKEQAAAVVEEARKRLNGAGITATGKTREGPAAAEILAEAEEWGADIIVLGSRGHTGLARLVLGSVAKSVLTHAHCSVLVVHVPHTEKPKSH